MNRYIIRFEKGSFGYNFHTYFDKSSLQNTSLNGCIMTLKEVNEAICEQFSIPDDNLHFEISPYKYHSDNSINYSTIEELIYK